MANDLTGAQRAAMLVMSLDEDRAATLLQNMSDGSLAKLRRATESLNVAELGPEDKRKTLLGFLRRQQGTQFFLGDAGDRFRKVLVKARGDEGAQQIYSAVDESEVDEEDVDMEAAEESEAWRAIASVPEDELARMIEDEGTRCAAVLLSAFLGEKAARLLNIINPALREKIVLRMVTMEHLSPEIIAEVVEGFQSRVEAIQRGKLGASVLTEGKRIDELASLMAGLERETQERIIGVIREKNPEVADRIEKQIFSFDDLVNVDSRSLQQFLGQIESRLLATAIKGTPQATQDYILANLSVRVRDQVAEERDLAGKIPLSQALEAREEIMQVARELEKSGQLSFKATQKEAEEYVE